MSDHLLRKGLIRLANKHPEHRALLVPLLREKKAWREPGSWDQTIAGEKMRCRVSEDSDTILIEEMPGKPMKRQVRRMRFSTWEMRRGQWFHGVSHWFHVENLMKDARISPNMSYDAAVGHVWTALDMAMEKAIAESEELAVKYPKNYSVYTEADFKRYRLPSAFGYETEVSWLEIEPKDYKPIQFRGKDFGGTSEWHEFRFYADSQKDEWMEQMEGMRAFYQEKSKGGARKLFKLLKAVGSESLRNMDLKAFEALLDKSKIAYSWVPTVWR